MELCAFTQSSWTLLATNIICSLQCLHSFLKIKNCRHGIFSSTELATFDLLTRRLSSTQQLFQHPHPLGQRSETVSVAPSYKQWFLEMCIEKQLPGLLYAFLDFYRYAFIKMDVLSARYMYIYLLKMNRMRLWS